MTLKLITLTLVLLLCGCNIVSNSKNDIMTEYDFKIGTQGLSARFIQNMPPEKIFENDAFNIGLELENKGAYDIDDLIITRWYGFVQDNLEIKKEDDPQRKLSLKGKSLLYPEGEKRNIFWEAKNKRFAKDEKTPQELLSANICYEYRTEFSEDICIDPTINQVINNLNTKKPCEIASLTFNGQGAPIAVTKVEQTQTSINEKTKITFYITIENKGNGELISTLDDCADEDKDKLEVEEIQFSDYFLYSGIQCKELSSGSDKKIHLKDKKTTITCEVELDKSKGAYETPLSIKLKYIYKLPVLSKKIQIKKLDSLKS